MFLSLSVPWVVFGFIRLTEHIFTGNHGLLLSTPQQNMSIGEITSFCEILNLAGNKSCDVKKRVPRDGSSLGEIAMKSQRGNTGPATGEKNPPLYLYMVYVYILIYKDWLNHRF